MQLGSWNQVVSHEALAGAGAAGAVEPRLVLGSFRHGGVVGTTNATKHWPQTATYLNGYLKGRCEDAGVAAESWNSLAVSFSGDMPLHRDSNNRRGTHNFLCCAGKFSGGELWVESAEAVETQHRSAPCPWHEEPHPPGYTIPVKGGALIKFDARVQRGVLPHTGERTSGSGILRLLAGRAPWRDGFTPWVWSKLWYYRGWCSPLQGSVERFYAFSWGCAHAVQSSWQRA